jgi:AraC-like DNA-binding protein
LPGPGERVKDEGMDDKPMIERVIKYVLTLSDEEFTALSVFKIAQDLNIDRFKLSREFKSQRDMTLEDFLFKEKMTRSALMLLAYRDFTIKEVAERLGFCTCDYFIRKFRQFYGIVPGKYREYKMPRSGIGDRRSGLKDRRHKVKKSKIPKTGDRRTGPKDRRNGRKDRRKQHNNHHDPDMKAVPGQNGEKGNSCENCYFKKFALNCDDMK